MFVGWSGTALVPGQGTDKHKKKETAQFKSQLSAETTET